MKDRMAKTDTKCTLVVSRDGGGSTTSANGNFLPTTLTKTKGCMFDMISTPASILATANPKVSCVITLRVCPSPKRSTGPRYHVKTHFFFSLSLSLYLSHSLSLSHTLSHSHTLTLSPSHPLTLSPSHPLTLSLSHSLILSLSLTLSLSHSLTHSLTHSHSLPHALPHSLTLSHSSHSLNTSDSTVGRCQRQRGWQSGPWQFVAGGLDSCSSGKKLAAKGEKKDQKPDSTEI